MTDSPSTDSKKIPRNILIIGTIQAGVGLWMIMSMGVLRQWDLLILAFAIGYTALGAGLLAVMEWARFISVVIHPMILVFLLVRAFNGGAGLITATQVAIVLFILHALTRPEIRAKFRGEPYPASQ